MKISWYVNRLRNMEPAEIRHRIAEHVRKSVSRGRHEGWQRFPAPGLHPVLPSLAAAISGATPQQRNSVAHAAETILSGRFAALGRDWPRRDPANLFPEELWRLDPVTGRPWPGPETYTFDIGFRHDGSRGDIKYVWEINRLQVLPLLAVQLLLSGDTRCLSAMETAIESWHRANPPFRGVGWASGIEVALRAISLLITLDLAGSMMREAARKCAGEILAASAFWLPRFPSRFSSANNHLVAELAGEFLLGIAFARDTKTARAGLIAEAARQIHPDGTGAEQTPTYAAFTAELLLLCCAAARADGNPMPAGVTDRLAAFADMIAWLRPENPGFGDDDEGRVLTSVHEPDYLRSVAAAIAGFLQRPAMPADAGDFRALFFRAPRESKVEPGGLRTFAHGGLSVWRGEPGGRRVHLSFDHGPLGYLSIAAHGHADALALTLAVDDQPVLVDPGTFLYGSGGIWRNWFRSTPAHNTLNIDGQSQSIISGGFNWSSKAAIAGFDRRDEPDFLLRASHDGYRKRFGVVHKRTVSREESAIVVVDQLEGGARDVEIVYQLAPDLVAERNGAAVSVRRGSDIVLRIDFPDEGIELSRGGAVPGEGGWVSPRFGVKLPATRLAWRGRVDHSGVTTRLHVWNEDITIR